MKISARTPQSTADASGKAASSDQAAGPAQGDEFAEHLAKFETPLASARPDATGIAGSSGETTASSTSAGSTSKTPTLLSLLTAATNTNGLDGTAFPLQAALADASALSSETKANVAKSSVASSLIASKQERATAKPGDDVAVPGSDVGAVPSAGALAQAGVITLQGAAIPIAGSATAPHGGSASPTDGTANLLALQSIAETITQKAGSKDRDADGAVDATAPIGLSHVTLTSQIVPPSSTRAGSAARTASLASIGPSNASDASVSPVPRDAPSPTVASTKLDKSEVAGPESAQQDATPSPSLAFAAASPLSTAPRGTADTGPADADASPTAAGSGPSEPTTTAPGPARTMTVQLAPSELGTVSVRMHVTGSTLDMKLSVAEPQTLGLINRDHDALANALRDQQYDLNSLLVQSMATDPTSSGDQNAQSRPSANQNGAPSDGQARSGSGSNAQEQSSTPGRNQQRSGSASPDRTVERGGDTLFV